MAVYSVDGWGAMWGRAGFSAQNLEPGSYNVSYTVFNFWGEETDSEQTTIIVDNDAYIAELGARGPFGSAGLFSAFTFGDIDGIKDFRGPIAARGNVALENVSINLESGVGVAVRAGQNASLRMGSAKGDVQYAGMLNTDQTFGLLSGAFESYAGDGSYQQYFYLVESNLETISDEIALQAADGDVSGAWGEIILTGYDDWNVFRLTQQQLQDAWSIKIKSRPNATVVIDVTGDAPYVHGNIDLSGISEERVLWNFNAASSLRIAYVDFKGTALALDADADVRGGSFIGGLFAKNLTGSAVGFLWAPYEALTSQP
jgi:choice-of-anchor A domain-containing protein